MCQLLINDPSHSWEFVYSSANDNYTQIRHFKASADTHQLRYGGSDCVWQAITFDHNDRFAWIGNGLQTMYAYCDLYYESVPHNVNDSGVFIGIETIQMDNHTLQITHQFFERAVAGIPISRAWLPKNYIRIANLLHSAWFDVCYSSVFAQTRRYVSISVLYFISIFLDSLTFFFLRNNFKKKTTFHYLSFGISHRSICGGETNWFQLQHHCVRRFHPISLWIFGVFRCGK